jgi:hypothetical protein
MKARMLVWFSAVLFIFSAAYARGEGSAPQQFQVKEKTEVPNTTLQPGTYSIQVLDRLQDRVILQVSSKGNHVQSTFLAVPAATMANAPVGPITYSTGPKGKAALKGFAFPGGLAVEFVYPKNDAVSIASANGTRVMAIDPASEGRVAAPKLNQDDMQMITLWMLEPARVGPGDAKPTISASRYQAPQPAAPAAPVQTAEAQPQPHSEQAPTSTADAASSVAPASAAAPATSATDASTASHSSPVQVAQNDVPPRPVRHHTRPANVKALPHTASFVPLLWLGTFASFLLGGAMSLRRYALRS